ncbi:MAG: hypothetical protein HY225_03380 [Candidatus Vogelbacteria bacterium]|nr:hypothetical protein [Candidatus Vogelbacteria bacterium]
MFDAEDPTQNKVDPNVVVIDRARLKKETELRKDAMQREAKKRTLKALAELRDPSLNPFASLAKLKIYDPSKKLSSEKASAKKKRRMERLKITLAGLEVVREEMAHKKSTASSFGKLSSRDSKTRRNGPQKPYDRNKKSGPQQDKSRRSRHELVVNEDDVPEEYRGTAIAKSIRRQRRRRR